MTHQLRGASMRDLRERMVKQDALTRRALRGDEQWTAIYMPEWLTRGRILPSGSMCEQWNIPQVRHQVNSHPPTGTFVHDLCITSRAPFGFFSRSFTLR
jgi:hypothetical protein